MEMRPDLQFECHYIKSLEVQTAILENKSHTNCKSMTFLRVIRVLRSQGKQIP
jgi:hypothetical protein